MMDKLLVILPKHLVSVNLVMNVVTRAANKVDLGSLVTFTGKNESYVKSAVTAACLLGMVNKCEKELYLSSKDCSEILLHTPSDETKTVVFRKWLQKWDPFILFLRYINSGDSSDIAARKLSSYYNFSLKAQAVAKLLLNWAKSTGLVNAKGKPITIDYAFDNKEILNNFSVNLIDDVAARLFLVDRLSEEVFIWLDNAEIEELTNSLVKYQSDPRTALECAGRAFEDVLRKISSELNMDSSKLSGISQVANNLYSYRDTNGQQHSFIHSKLHKVSLALGNLRNMAGHSKEAKTMERWDLSSTGAIGGIITVISTIRSLFYYIRYNIYKF